MVTPYCISSLNLLDLIRIEVLRYWRSRRRHNLQPRLVCRYRRYHSGWDWCRGMLPRARRLSHHHRCLDYWNRCLCHPDYYMFISILKTGMLTDLNH